MPRVCSLCRSCSLLIDSLLLLFAACHSSALMQALEGTVLQQLQAQSDKLSAVAQAMSHHAAECIEDSGPQADQPAAESDEAAVAEECTLNMVGC
jgi:ribosomal protein L12E/L44/L45/RPP1/RPP2